MTRNDILNQLKDDLEKIKVSVSPYKTSIAEIKRGVYNFSDIVNFPTICFCMERETTEDEMFDSAGASQVKFLNVFIYGYLNNDYVDDFTNIHNFVADVEYFLNNDFTYKSNTYTGDIGIIEGGSSVNCSYFDMKVKIIYECDV